MKNVLTQYSTFVPYPIKLAGEWSTSKSPSGRAEKQRHRRAVSGVLRALTHGAGEKPRWHLHLTSDSPFQFHAILYCPERTSNGWARPCRARIAVVCQRILVQHNCRELLPEYLRFHVRTRGPADLPLNVSSRGAAGNTVFRKIKKVLTKKVPRSWSRSPPTSRGVPGVLSSVRITLRDRIALGLEHREELAGLLRSRPRRFHRKCRQAAGGFGEAGRSTEPLTGFKEYSACPEGQKQIYFLPVRTGSRSKRIEPRSFPPQEAGSVLSPTRSTSSCWRTLRNFQGKDLVGN